MHRPYGADPPRRMRPSVFVAALAVLLLGGSAATAAITAGHDRAPVAAQPLTPSSPLPTPGRTGSSICTNPQASTQWRVTWRASGEQPTPGPGESLRTQAESIRITPIGFSSRTLPGSTPPTEATPGETPASPLAAPGPDGWTERDDEVWNLRWTPLQAQALSRQTADANQREGTLRDLAAISVSAAQSPRYVTPDGSCTVFATPFLAGQTGGRTVAVLGDSLTAQLYASLDGLETSEGALQQQLETLGYRPEINGQAGRRWTALPDTAPGIAQANADMVDEIRGLREAQSVVVALGVNDAGWVALSPDEQTYQLRMSWVLLHLAPVLDELRDKGHCTVLVTMSAGDQTYLSSAKGLYQRAASRINAYLTERAGQDPGDRLRLWDWGSSTEGHHTRDPAPWFGRDTIHLNVEGQLAYAQALADAAQQC